MPQNVKQDLIQKLIEGKISRRDFIAKAVALGLSGTAIGALVHNSASAQAQDTVLIQWWDQFLPLAPLHQEMWNVFMEANPGVQIQYSQYNPPDLAQSIQLAYRSNQAPDIHSHVLGVPVSRLVDQGWFMPIEPHITRDTGALRDVLFEGLTVFNGLVYSFPIFNSRWHTTLNWFNRQLLEDAGHDPDNGPRTWEEVREVARNVTNRGQGRTFGMLLPLQFTARMSAHVTDLAQAAGAPGAIDHHTGRYIYDSEPFVQAIEFLLAFEQDGTLHPASSSLDARQGRARWAAGEAAMFTDGPWNIGVVQTNFPEIMDNVGVASIPVPDGNQPVALYAGPPSGTFWVSSQSQNPEVAAQVLQMFTEEEYYVRLAERMDQPPLDLSAVDRANVHHTYQQAMGHYQEVMRLSPQPLIKNPNVSDVLSEMREINPNLGEIVQGVFSGAVRDIRATLADFNNRMEAERQRAIEVVQGRGVEVSLDDWVFSNWQPGEDYTTERYEELES